MSIKLIRERSSSFIDAMNKSGGEVALDESSILLLDQIIEASGAIELEGEAQISMVETFGSFLGEAMVSVLGMEWEQRKEDGQWVISGRADNTDVVTLDPFNKMYKRFKNGEEDSISYFYQMVKKALEGKLPEQKEV
jgi:hypothetical protein